MKNKKKIMAGVIKPRNFYSAYPKKIKPHAFTLNGKRLANDSMNLAKAGIGLAFTGLTLGIAVKAFKNAFE